MDNYEITLMFQGVSGCGKSTIVNIMRHFWPNHHVGLMSSDEQKQFDIGQLSNKRVCFCHDAHPDLQIAQNEWQDACAGRAGFFTVERDEIVTWKRWTSQFLWAGRDFPSRFNNDQRQVSRRLAGIYMAKRIERRDGRILNYLRNKLGQLQRKNVLAYRSMVHVHQYNDPMLTPEKLPMMYKAYYEGKYATDPIEDFLTNSKTIRFGDHEVMLMCQVCKLFHDYCLQKGLEWAHLAWEEDNWRTPLGERNIAVRCMGNLKVIYGMGTA